MITGHFGNTPMVRSLTRFPLFKARVRKYGFSSSQKRGPDKGYDHGGKNHKTICSVVHSVLTVKCGVGA